VPDRGLVLAIHANGGHASAFIDEVLAEILASAPGIRLPPDTPMPFRPETYAGSYSAPSVTYEVKADADGLEIIDIPHGLAAQLGRVA
jgi:hypothetical protein